MIFSLFLPSFRHGIHPEERKEQTKDQPIRRMPFVKHYILPLSQHIGSPSRPVVTIGEEVSRGQLLAEAATFVSTNLHSPVSGRVIDIGRRRHYDGELTPAIVIEADPYATQRTPALPPINWQDISRQEFIEHIQKAGLVGLGGAAFPSHVKYNLPEGKDCEWLVINGCECEPYLTCDHRLMAEYPDDIIRGIEIASSHLRARGVVIGVETNKPDAIQALVRAVKPGQKIDVIPLEVKYPQGAEKMLIKAIFGREVPAGKFPLDLGMIVNNVGTMAAIARYFDYGIPMIERIVTVTGPGIISPANLVVPIGTRVKDVLRHCGLKDDAQEAIFGGPMMGRPLASLDVPVLKGTSGIIVFTEAENEHRPEYTCIRCGRCLEACSNFLNPSRMVRLARAHLYDEMMDNFIMDCTECAACTFGCPSGIPIIQHIRVAKSAIRKKRKGN
jgi:electron transport complex protein RnfC